jgi:hypothetical protein
LAACRAKKYPAGDRWGFDIRFEDLSRSWHIVARSPVSEMRDLHLF